MPSFRVNSRRFLITWPQCSASIEQAVEHLTSVGAAHGRVCRELHEDGNPHLHAAVEFSSRKDIRNANYFDINEFHANIQAAKTWAACMNYVKKDGDFQDFGNPPITPENVIGLP